MRYKIPIKFNSMLSPYTEGVFLLILKYILLFFQLIFLCFVLSSV